MLGYTGYIRPSGRPAIHARRRVPLTFDRLLLAFPLEARREAERAMDAGRVVDVVPLDDGSLVLVVDGETVAVSS